MSTIVVNRRVGRCQAKVTAEAGLFRKPIGRIASGQDVRTSSVDMVEQTLEPESSIEHDDARILNRTLFEFGKFVR